MIDHAPGEEWTVSEGEWVKIADADLVAERGMVGAQVGDEYVAVYSVDGMLYATSDLCTHAWALLSDGFLDGHVVECPLHGACFDIRTGKGMAGPVGDDLTVYPVRCRGNDVEVQIAPRTSESADAASGGTQG